MKPIFDILTEIADRHLNIPTLQTRRSDSLDFHDVSVWGVKDALLAAYQSGQHARCVPAAGEEAAEPPIVIITVRGGCVAIVEATTPLRVILEDWDCENRLTGKKPYRAELSCTGDLSRKRASHCLRHL